MLYLIAHWLYSLQFAIEFGRKSEQIQSKVTKKRNQKNQVYMYCIDKAKNINYSCYHFILSKVELQEKKGKCVSKVPSHAPLHWDIETEKKRKRWRKCSFYFSVIYPTFLFTFSLPSHQLPTSSGRLILFLGWNECIFQTGIYYSMQKLIMIQRVT